MPQLLPLKKLNHPGSKRGLATSTIQRHRIELLTELHSVRCCTNSPRLRKLLTSSTCRSMHHQCPRWFKTQVCTHAASITRRQRCSSGSMDQLKLNAKRNPISLLATSVKNPASLRLPKRLASCLGLCVSFSSHLVSGAAASFQFCHVPRSGDSEITSIYARIAEH